MAALLLALFFAYACLHPAGRDAVGMVGNIVLQFRQPTSRRLGSLWCRWNVFHRHDRRSLLPGKVARKYTDKSGICRNYHPLYPRTGGRAGRHSLRRLPHSFSIH